MIKAKLAKHFYLQRMEESQGKENCRNIFCINNIPQDSQLRYILDNIPSHEFAPNFQDLFGRLRRHKHLEDYIILPNVLMCTIDGTHYHSSKNIPCDCCPTKEHRAGEITYSYAVLQGAIIHPDKKQVVPMIETTLANGMYYLFVAKPGDH